MFYFLSIACYVIGGLTIISGFRLKIKNPTGSLTDQEVIYRQKAQIIVIGLIIVVVGYFLKMHYNDLRAHPNN